METGLPGVTQVLVIRPVEEVRVRDKERAPTHPPLEMEKTAKEVIQNGSPATHNHVSTVTIELIATSEVCVSYIWLNDCFPTPNKPFVNLMCIRFPLVGL